MIKAGYEVIKKKGGMVSEWTKENVGDIALINTDTYSQKDKWKFVNYLDTGNITEGAISNIQFISDIKSLPSRAKRKVQQGDIVYSTVRPNQKHYGVIAAYVENMLVSTGFAVLRGIKGKCDTKFLYYFLTQKQVIEHLQTIAEHSTSAYPSIRPSHIESLYIKLPPLYEQRAIAHILGTLDDKIELNRKMNETLEAMARAIFKSWFVDFDPVRAKSEGRPTGLPEEIDALFPDSFESTELGKIPSGWKAGKIIECCERVENGGTPSRNVLDYWEPKEVPWLTSGEVRQRIVCVTDNFISYNGLNNSSVKLWPKGTTVVALYGATAGQISLLANEMCANQACCGLVPKNKWRFYIYLHSLASVLSLELQARGSAQQNLSQQIVANLLMLLPNQSVITAFDIIVTPLFNKWTSNLFESRTLAAIRDALLPKLISGEIRVKDMEKAI